MKLIVDNAEEIECTKVVKGEDFIDVYDGDNVIWQFGGISDFSGYELVDGEYSSPEPTQLEKMQAQIDMLMKILAEKEG